MGLMLPPGLVRRDELTADGVRCWDADLEALCTSVDDVFRRPASRENLRAMVRGLLSDVPRKNMWQVAEAAEAVTELKAVPKDRMDEAESVF